MLDNARILKIYEEFPTETVNPNDLFVVYKPSTGQTHAILGSDLFPADIDSESFTWSSTFNYSIDDVVISGEKWWISAINGNTGNVPGSIGNQWIQINKVTTGGLKKWVPGLYLNEDEYVVNNLIIYELNSAAGRPFNSVSSPAIDTANWSAVGASGGSNTQILDTYTDMINFPNPEDTQLFYVVDASADPTVDSGGAQYIYRAATTSFIKIAEFESQDIDFTDFTRNTTGESNLDITPSSTAFYATILTLGKAKLKPIIDFLTANRNVESISAETAPLAALVLDLAGREVITLNQTLSHSVDFTNEQVGKTYTLIVTRTINANFNFVAGRFTFPFGRAPLPTNPNNNSSSPAFAKDIYTMKCFEAGRLTVVLTPDLRDN